MRSTFIAAALAFAAAPSFLSVSAAAGQQVDKRADSNMVAPPLRSRHATKEHRPRTEQNFAATLEQHRKRSSHLGSSGKKHKRGSKCGAQKVIKEDTDEDSTTGTIEEQQNNSTSTGSSGGADKVDWDMDSNFLKIGNIFAGFLPDDASGGGKKDTMAQLNAVLPAKSAFYGRYAQVTNGKIFDGSQIYSMMDDIKASGAILHASIMPYGTWYGLTESDNRNAIAIAKVCDDIYKTHGVEVWLRFAHEMNWYQVDGTYSGSVQDFQTGWKVVAKAIEEHAPQTKMYWSPNVGSDADYERYWPKEGRVDVVGFDWYPNDPYKESFYDRAKAFHDRYTADGAIMVQGETGLHYSGTDEEKMQWVKQLSDDKVQGLKNYMGWAWFNYDKFENGRQVDFKIIKPGSSAAINDRTVSFFSAGSKK